VLTAEQAAELLQVTEAEVLALAEAGTLPGRRIGDKWRFSRPALIEWLAGA
jgi:excisionase family DNA binding protein